TRVEIRDTRTDVAKHTVDVGSVHLAGGEVRIWAPGAQGARLNLLELIGPAGAPASTAGAAAPSSGTTPSGPPPVGAPPGATGEAPAAWAVSLPEIALDGLKIIAEDRQSSPTVAMHLSDLAVHISGYTTSRATPIGVAVSTKINQSAKLEAKADVSPDLATLKA